MWPRATAALSLIILGPIALASAMAQSLPGGFVYLRDIDPTIAQDIRYAGTDNFVGHPLPGYAAAECVLQEFAAQALAAVQADLAARKLGLKVYDCYRPTQAVRAMISWASEGPSDPADAGFFPHIRKGELLRQGYIAAQSAHSTGLAIDLTLVPLDRPSTGVAPGGPCHGPADDSLDMGTTFDCFDPVAHTAALGIGAAARRNRAILVAAMQLRGFVNYRREWWHFTFESSPRSGHFDFPIVARQAR